MVGGIQNRRVVVTVIGTVVRDGNIITGRIVTMGVVLGDREIMEIADDGTGYLGNAVGRAHQMCRKGDWWNAGVGDANIGETVDTEACIDNTALLERQHRARR